MNLNKKLSDILDPKKIEVVKNPIEKAHGLPNECYLNDDYLEFEKKKKYLKIIGRWLGLQALYQIQAMQNLLIF